MSPAEPLGGAAETARALGASQQPILGETKRSFGGHEVAEWIRLGRTSYPLDRDIPTKGSLGYYSADIVRNMREAPPGTAVNIPCAGDATFVKRPDGQWRLHSWWDRWPSTDEAARWTFTPWDPWNETPSLLDTHYTTPPPPFDDTWGVEVDATDLRNFNVPVGSELRWNQPGSSPLIKGANGLWHYAEALFHEHAGFTNDSVRNRLTRYVGPSTYAPNYTARMERTRMPPMAALSKIPAGVRVQTGGPDRQGIAGVVTDERAQGRISVRTDDGTIWKVLENTAVELVDPSLRGMSDFKALERLSGNGLSKEEARALLAANKAEGKAPSAHASVRERGFKRDTVAAPLSTMSGEEFSPFWDGLRAALAFLDARPEVITEDDLWAAYRGELSKTHPAQEALELLEHAIPGKIEGFSFDLMAQHLCSAVKDGWQGYLEILDSLT